MAESARHGAARAKVNPRERVELVLEPAPRLSVRVRSVDGGAAPATVSSRVLRPAHPDGALLEQTTELWEDDGGTHWWVGCPPGAHQVEVGSASTAWVERTVEVPPRGEAHLEVVLEPLVELQGTLYAGGAPVPGVSVSLKDTRHSLKSNRDGRFRFEGLERRRYRLVIQNEDHSRTHEVDVEAPDGDLRVDLPE